MKSYRDPRDPSRYIRLKRRTQRTNSQEFPWTRMLVGLLALAAIGFVARDVRSHGSFEASDTARFLQSTVAVYSRQGFVWLRANLPYFLTECVRVLRPLGQQGLVMTRMAAKFVSKQIVWLIIWLKKNNPLIVQWVNTNTPECPDAAYQVLGYFKERSLFVHENYVLPGVAYASERLQGAWNDLQQ